MKHLVMQKWLTIFHNNTGFNLPGSFTAALLIPAALERKTVCEGPWHSTGT
jgi:hypothetical protein